MDCILNCCHARLFVNDAEAELVPFAKRSGLGLINALPRHMGLLAARPVPDWHPAPPRLREAALKVRALCHQFGIDPGTLALQVCLNRPDIASTFIGIGSVGEVKAAVAALELRPPEELLEAIQKIIAPVHNIAWPCLEENQIQPLSSAGGARASH